MSRLRPLVYDVRTMTVREVEPSPLLRAVRGLYPPAEETGEPFLGMYVTEDETEDECVDPPPMGGPRP
jgi:hypothetical protein